LLQRAGVFSTPFRAGATDATTFNLGMQNFGLGLLGEVMSDSPDEYLTMQKEAMTAEKKRKQEQQPVKENDPLGDEQ
jgi:hypothetical protein